MFLIEEFKDKYDVETQSLMIGGSRLSYYLPRTIEPFIDPDFPMNNFPLWAKVWPATMVLADFMASEPVDAGKRILEIGAGIGIAGIAASMCGHDVTISEYNTHALEFIKANACINGCMDTPVISLDWNQPVILNRYDQIIGSEVIFRQEDFLGIQKLFLSVLKPGGQATLVSEIRKPVIEFFRQMQQRYHVRAQQKVLRSHNEEIKIIICHINPKPE